MCHGRFDIINTNFRYILCVYGSRFQSKNSDRARYQGNDCFVHSTMDADKVIPETIAMTTASTSSDMLLVTSYMSSDTKSDVMVVEPNLNLAENLSNPGELVSHRGDDISVTVDQSCSKPVEDLSKLTECLDILAKKDADSASQTILSVLASDLMFCLSKQLGDKLSHIEISFSCKVCQMKRSSLREVIHHLEDDNCKSVKRGRGRPRKYPLAAGIKPEKSTKKVKEENPPKILEPNTPGRRTTRISTGTIKRRNAAELLGIKTDTDEEDDELADCQPSHQTQEKHVNQTKHVGNADIVLNLQDLLQAASQVNCQQQLQQSSGEEQMMTNEVSLEKVNSDEAGVSNTGSDMVEVSVIQELQPKSQSVEQKQKVSFIHHSKLNLIPVSTAETSDGQKVITIKPGNAGGNVVIPSTDKSNQTRNIVIPHSLLLNALKEHKNDPKGEVKTIIFVDDAKEMHSPQHEEKVCKEAVDVDQTNDTNGNDPDFVVKSNQDVDSDDSSDVDDDGKVKHPRSSSRSIFKRGRPRTSFGGYYDKYSSRSSRPHRCNVCIVRYFSTEKELEVHLAAHVYKKEDIDTETSRKAKLAKRELFRCQECCIEIPNWNRILRHMMSHEVYQEKLKGTDFVRNIFGNFLCPVCKKSFDKKYNMIMHWKKIHHKQTRTCEVCKKDLTSVDDKTFSRHVDKCRNVTYQCEHCSYHTTVHMNMRRHMRVHTGHGFVCDVCSKVFPTRQRCMVHQERHKANRPRYSCEVCSKLFLTIDALKKHFARFHVRSEQFFPCPKCKYVAKVQSDLPKHDKLVHDKKFKCDHDGCTYMTNSEVSFQQHKEYHSPDRLFPCPYSNCYYSGCTAKQLSDHCTSIHNMHSKHQCPICQKFFKKKTHLLRHLVVHTGDQPYMCLECGQSFYSHSTYYRHRRKTGHDFKREGIASVPQNIIITYVQEDGREESKVAFSAKNQPKKDGFTEEDSSLENLLMEANDSVQLDSSTNQVMSTQESAITSDHVVFVETTETQVIDGISQMNQGQPVSILATESINQIVQQVPIHDNLMEDQINDVATNLPPASDTKMITDSDVVSNMITIPDGDSTQQYTYILSSEQAQNMISGNQMTLNLPDNTINMDVLQKPLGEDLVEEVLYKEGTNEQSVGTVVEVTPPGSDGQNGQYAILLVPSATRDEPEAAISMLQLQSSLQ